MEQEKIRLIEKYIDQELSECEQSKLLGLLENDHNFREDFALNLQLKGLFFCCQHQDYSNLEERVNAVINDQSSLEDKVMQRLPQDTYKPKRQLWLTLAIAAQFLIVASIFFIVPSRKNLKQVAEVTDITGLTFIVRGEQKLNLKIGDELYNGDQFYVQDENQLSLRYNDGSRLKLLKGTYARLSEVNNRKRIELFSGLIEADIEKQKKKMHIITEHSLCEVLGTSFSLSSSDVSSLLDVQKGSVRFKEIDSENSLIVSAQQYATAGDGQKFQTKATNKPIYRSPLITKQTATRSVDIDLKLDGAKRIYLVVSNGGDNNRFDHTVWIRPRLSGKNGELDLIKFPWKIAKSGCFSIQKNRGFLGEPLLVNGQNIQHGIATHATSVIAWDIPEGYERFQAKGAILDSGVYQKKGEITVPSVYFEIYTTMPEKMLNKLLIRRQHY